MTPSAAPIVTTSRGALTRAPRKPQTYWEQATRRLLRDQAGIVGLAILGLLVAAAILAPVIAPADPYEIGAGMPFAPPSR